MPETKRGAGTLLFVFPNFRLVSYCYANNDRWNDLSREGKDLKYRKYLKEPLNFVRRHRQKSKVFVVIIFIIFLIIKLSLFNYLNFVSNTEARFIIRDFEKNYLFYNVFGSTDYVELKEDLLANSFTTKSKIYEMLTKVKELAGDSYTEIRYVDLLHGKFNPSPNKRMGFTKKNLSENILYIRISSFGQNSAAKFTKAMENRKTKDFLVLDLRGNNTGNYNEAVHIANDLLPTGTEIVEIECSNSKHIFYSNPIYYEFKKIYVLVDNDSGFCSEMVALSLKDNLGRRVSIIGDETQCIDIGSVYKTYNSRIAINVASIRWNTNSKGAKDLNKFIISLKEIKEFEEDACIAKVINLMQ